MRNINLFDEAKYTKKTWKFNEKIDKFLTQSPLFFWRSRQLTHSY